MESLTELVNRIARHQQRNPHHGVNCSCMDHYIQHVRNSTQCADPEVQKRVDYVIKTAIENRR